MGVYRGRLSRLSRTNWVAVPGYRVAAATTAISNPSRSSPCRACRLPAFRGGNVAAITAASQAGDAFRAVAAGVGVNFEVGQAFRQNGGHGADCDRLENHYKVSIAIQKGQDHTPSPAHVSGTAISDHRVPSTTMLTILQTRPKKALARRSRFAMG